MINFFLKQFDETLQSPKIFESTLGPPNPSRPHPLVPSSTHIDVCLPGKASRRPRTGATGTRPSTPDQRRDADLHRTPPRSWQPAHETRRDRAATSGERQVGTSRRDHRHVDVVRRSLSSSSGPRGDVLGGGGWAAGTPVRPGRETSWRRIRRPSCRVGVPTPSPRNVYRGIRTLHPLEFLFSVFSIFFLLEGLSFCINLMSFFFFFII